MKARLSIGILLCMCSGATWPAAAPVSPVEVVHTLPGISSTTTQADSGPPIWTYTRGNRTLFVLGTLPYAKKKIVFDASQIEQRVAQSDAVLSAPGLVMGENIGLLRGLTLWRSIHKQKFDPQHRMLAEQLTATTYQKWQAARGRFGVGSASVERMRPMYAAYELFEAASTKADLRMGNPASDVIERVARKRGLRTLDARLMLSIDNPGSTIRQFSVAPSDDIACLQETLDRVGRFVDAASALGEAWSQGDVASLEYWARSKERPTFCWSWLTNQAIAKQQGIPDLSDKIDGKWMTELERAFTGRGTVFTTLPITEVFDDNGLGGALRRAGYQVHAPE